MEKGKVNGDQALRQCDGLLRLFADKAEREVAANADTPLRKAGTRCRGPDVSWQSILREQPAKGARPVAAARWAKCVVQTIKHKGGIVPREQSQQWIEEAEKALLETATALT